MKKEISIFDGTFLGEVYSFQGKLLPVTEPDNDLCDITEVPGEMWHIEKVIYTLTVLKIRKLFTIGKNIPEVMEMDNDTSNHNIEAYNIWANKKENLKMFEKIFRLSKQIQGLQRTLNALIQARLPVPLKPGQNIGIRPGYKVVIGHEPVPFILSTFAHLMSERNKM